MRQDSALLGEIEVVPEDPIPDLCEPVHPEPVRGARRSEDGAASSLLGGLLSMSSRNTMLSRNHTTLRPFSNMPGRWRVSSRRASRRSSEPGLPPPEEAQALSREVTLTRRKNLFRSTRPHWLADDNNFRAVELQKRTENEQMSALDSMDNSWSHTKLFFSHCW